MLTFTDTVTLLIAVVTLHDGTVDLGLLLLTVSGDVTELVATKALGQAAGDDVTGISQALHDLLVGLGPTLLLGSTAGLVGQAVVDRVLLVQVALQVHVGQGDGEVLALQRNQV